MGRLLSVDTSTLELLLITAELGTIRKAATRSHLALAAASRRISEFEGRIGVEIFQRQARGMQVTPQGRVILARVKSILSGVQNLVDTVEDIKGGVTEHLHLLSNNSAIMHFLPELLGTYASKNPYVRVEVEEMVSTDIVRALTERRSRLGLLWSDADMRGLESVELAAEELVVIAPLGHSLGRRRTVRFAAALEFDFVGLRGDSPLYAGLKREASKLNKVLRTRMQVHNFDAMCRMVASGLGIGVMGLRAAKGLAKSMAISIVALREPWAHRKFCLAHCGAHELLPVEREFLVFVLSQNGRQGSAFEKGPN